MILCGMKMIHMERVWCLVYICCIIISTVIHSSNHNGLRRAHSVCIQSETYIGNAG